ncbi:MAG: hypothetical protein K2F99_05200, partial [Muribaculaceae bacterium]|nr:hypothetical protein [Muribaculaceae bacterium]
GAGLAVHKASLPWLGRYSDGTVVRILSWTVTFSFVALLWVFFRADSWSSSVEIIRAVGRDFSLAYIPAFVEARLLWVVLMLLIIVAHCLPRRFWNRAAAAFVVAPWIVKLLAFLVLIQAVLELRSEAVSPFIYFQF